MSGERLLPVRGWALPGLGSRVMEGPEPEPGPRPVPRGPGSREQRTDGENCGGNYEFVTVFLFLLIVYMLSEINNIQRVFLNKDQTIHLWFNRFLNHA